MHRGARCHPYMPQLSPELSWAGTLSESESKLELDL
jgi:hypothetical protein